MGIHRSYAERKSICEAWKQSGLPQVEFCRLNNINYRALGRWLGKLKKVSAGNVSEVAAESLPTAVKFLPVGKVFSEQKVLELLLPNGISCKVFLAEEKTLALLGRILRCK